MNKVPDEDKVLAMSPAATPSFGYTVELWDLGRRAPERTIGRASSLSLARAIFAAAQVEHLGRRILLLRGAEVIDESG